MSYDKNMCIEWYFSIDRRFNQGVPNTLNHAYHNTIYCAKGENSFGYIVYNKFHKTYSINATCNKFWLFSGTYRNTLKAAINYLHIMLKEKDQYYNKIISKYEEKKPLYKQLELDLKY